MLTFLLSIHLLSLLIVGRFDLNKYYLQCKQCGYHTDPFTVSVALQSGYWPGNARNVNYLFKEEVLKLWDMFRKFMPGSSERSFLKTLNAISDENFRVSNYYLFKCFFKFSQHWFYEWDQVQTWILHYIPTKNINIHSFFKHFRLSLI